jgi:chromosome segregation ATPase
MATLEERLNEMATDYNLFIREQGREAREVKARLAVMDTRLGTIDTRLNRMDERIDTLRESVDTLGERVNTLSGEVGSLRAEMTRKFDQILALLAPGA